MGFVKISLVFIALTSPLFEMELFRIGRSTQIKRVVAIAVDGIREVEGKPVFSVLRKKMAELGLNTFWYGKSDGCVPSQASNLSLPAYASIFTGKVQENLKDNHFRGKFLYKTLFSDYPDSQLFSAWPPLERIFNNDIEVRARIFIAGIGNKPHEDPFVMASFRLLYNPSNRFVFVHLGDADEFAHINQWNAYLAAVESEADYVHEIIQTSEIAKMKETLYYVLTDHGRGEKLWQHHGAYIPESHTMWIMEISPYSQPVMGAPCNHIALHDTIASILKEK
ncbi:MAG: hypothetical protein LDLANPLL_02567 [Turneriella sp.]|nr:hypothetical protein [Turneriella sp.]